MYAVIRTGGKQYRVAEGDWVDVEKLDVEAGSTIQFDEVLLVGDEDATHVGTPILEGAQVTGEVVQQGKGPKISVFKYKRRKGYRRKIGHRQPFTRITITAIGLDGAKKASKAKAPKKADAAEKDASKAKKAASAKADAEAKAKTKKAGGKKAEADEPIETPVAEEAVETAPVAAEAAPEAVEEAPAADHADEAEAVEAAAPAEEVEAAAPAEADDAIEAEAAEPAAAEADAVEADSAEEEAEEEPAKSDD